MKTLGRTKVNGTYHEDCGSNSPERTIKIQLQTCPNAHSSINLLCKLRPSSSVLLPYITVHRNRVLDRGLPS